MHKLIILIDRPKDIQTFEEAWPRFLREAERMPGLKREAAIQVVNTLFGDCPIYKIHELYFEDRMSLQDAMSSASGQVSGQILQQITGGRMSLLIADHREEQIENLRKYHESKLDTS